MAEKDTMEQNEPKAAIRIEISSDKMEARVSFDITKGTRLSSEEEIIEALVEKNVFFGLDHEAIRGGASSLVPFVAARGVRPVHGKDAYIDRKFDLGVKGRPKIDQFDRADFKARRGATSTGRTSPRTRESPAFCRRGRIRKLRATTSCARR